MKYANCHIKKISVKAEIFADNKIPINKNLDVTFNPRYAVIERKDIPCRKCNECELK